MRLANELKILEPFGQGNESPLFCSEKVRIYEARRFGEDGKHIKLIALNNEKRGIEIISFNNAEEVVEKIGGNLYDIPPIDIIYNLSINSFNGNFFEQLKLKDVKISKE